VEFRDKSWEGNVPKELLAGYDIANVITDSPLEIDTESSSNWSYVRYHGRGKSIWFDYKYSKEEILKMVSSLVDIKNNSSEVYAYFNNHYGANAVENALQMLEATANLTSEQFTLLNQFRMKTDLDSYM